MNDNGYCFMDVNYPDIGYVVFLFIFRESKPVGSLTLPIFYVNYFDAMKDIPKLIAEANMDTIAIPPEAVLFPATLIKLFPLHQKYWTEPLMHYDEWNRSIEFQKIALKPQLYDLLVTPTFIEDDGKSHLKAVIPLKDSQDSKTIENFMLTSDYVVDSRAKHAAIYSFQSKLRFNWKTGITEPVEGDEYPNMN